MSCNQQLLDLFDELYTYYMKLGDEHRAFAFFDTARLIETQYRRQQITSSTELAKWHGVGQATIDIVDEFLATGRCERLDEIKALLENEEEEEEEEEELEFEECVENFWDQHLSKVHTLDNSTPLEWVRATNLVYDEDELYAKSQLKKLGWFKFADKHHAEALNIIKCLPPATLHFLALELESMKAGTPDDDIDVMCSGCSLALEDRDECQCEEFQNKAYYEALGLVLPEINEEF